MYQYSPFRAYPWQFLYVFIRFNYWYISCSSTQWRFYFQNLVSLPHTILDGLLAQSQFFLHVLGLLFFRLIFWSGATSATCLKTGILHWENTFILVYFMMFIYINLLVESFVNISPAHWWICSCWPDCRQILLASEILVFIGVVMSFHIIIPYSVAQYVVSGLVMFVSAEVLEGDIFYLIQFLFIFLTFNYKDLYCHMLNICVCLR